MKILDDAQTLTRVQETTAKTKREKSAKNFVFTLIKTKQTGERTTAVEELSLRVNILLGKWME